MILAYHIRGPQATKKRAHWGLEGDHNHKGISSVSSFSKYKRLASALLFACLIQAPLAHSALIGLQPATTFANTGDSISLDLVISDLGSFSPDSLGAFDISVGFDASALSFTSYSLGDFLGDVDIAEAIDASGGDLGGAVNVAEVSLLSALALDTLQPGSFILATLNFNVIDLEVGMETQLSVQPGFVLADAFGFVLSATASGPASVQGGSSSVPVPGTLLLLVTSLFGWLTLKRRHSSLHQVK